ncbi:hypothetical protein M422DRAFT_238538 [Sphaerobolus stellatus SS14]|nr:hypothetical protein M422DRAFT_238538 [Sphaerobolus stellatus SS14]
MDELLSMLSSLGISPEDATRVGLDPSVMLNMLQQSSHQYAPPTPTTPEDLEAKIRKVIDNAAREKSLPPTKIITVPSIGLFSETALAKRRAFEKEFDGKKINIKTAYIGTEKYHSDGNIEDLNRINLRDMFVRRVHKKRYILCRIVAPPTRVISVDVYIEDPLGHGQLVCVYNFPSMLTAGPKELDALFPVGTVLAIREPYLKSALQNVNNTFIRVDSPTDIIFVRPSSPLLEGLTWRNGTSVPGFPPHLSSDIEWKARGNSHFKAGRWLAAAVAYTNGLVSRSFGENLAVLRANRAEAYLKLGYLSAALEDAKFVLSVSHIDDDIRGKVFCRAGRASYAQENYELAHEYFQKLMILLPDNGDARTWLDRTLVRQDEQKHGKYKWFQLFKDSHSSSGSPMDIADFVGSIAVACLPNRGGGRGIIATRDIEQGELILVAKPFVASFPGDFPQNESIEALNLVKNKLETACEVGIIHKTVERLYGNPDMHDFIYHLYAPHPHNPPPSLYAPRLSEAKLLDPLRTSIDIDVSHIESICGANAFYPQPQATYADFVKDKPLETTPCALYLLPSLFNHSCDTKTTRMFFRDIMVVRATARISKGEEIFITYVPLSSPYTSREETLQRQFGISCHCETCRIERLEDKFTRTRKKTLEEELEVIMARVACKSNDKLLSSTDMSKITSLITKLEATYSSNAPITKPTLARARHQFATLLQKQAYRSNGNPSIYHQAISEEIEALKALGVPITDCSIKRYISSEDRGQLPINTATFTGTYDYEMAVLIMLMIVACFLCIGQEIRAERWLRAALWMESISIGGGRKLFEERYKKILGKTGIQEFIKTIAL